MLDWIPVALLGAVLLMQIMLLVKSRKPEVPMGVLFQLEQLDRLAKELQSSVARLEGGFGAIAGQIQKVAETSGARSLEPVRQALDQKLVQVVAESRAGRGELVDALQQFESRLEQRLGGFDAMTAANRQELSNIMVGLRDELAKAVGYIAVESTKSRDALMENAGKFEARILERFVAMTATNQQTFDSLKADVGAQLAAMSAAVREQLEGSNSHTRSQLSFIQELLNRQMSVLAESSQQSAEQLRGTLNERLAMIQADNLTKLDEIRRTVDEKLHATLEQRLGASFQLVCDRLEQVHRGLGEMHALTAGVGDLKRVLTDVRTTGTWGEVQLGAIIGQILAPEQYARNVTTRPGNHACVDFALRLPGIQNEQPVWLPIDARFPMEDYRRLLDAVKRADEDGIRLAAQVLEDRVRNEAQALFDQHVCPPYTTDFAILYLPTEGLYAEVLRRPGLSEAMQRDYRVVLAGPTNLSAILNSLQMGFKTLTIEKRSAEVWSLLGEVKSEFGRFGDVLAATQEKLEAATHQFSEVSVRTRAIQQRLQRVEELPKPDMARVLSLVEPKLAAGDGVEA